MAVHVGQPEVSSLVVVGQLRVVNAQLVENCCL